MKNCNYFYLFLFNLTLLISIPAHSRSLNQELFLIPDFNSGQESIVFLDNAYNRVRNTNSWQGTNFGIALELEYSEKDQNIYIAPQSDGVLFSQVLNSIKNHTLKSYNKVFPLFLRFDNQHQEAIENTLKKSKIADNIFHQPEGQKWTADIPTLVREKKNIIVFSLIELSKSSKIITSASENIATLGFTSFKDPKFDGTYLSGSIENDFLMMKHFYNNHLSVIKKDKDWSDFNKNPVLPNYLKKCWLLTGKYPNFVFFDTEEDIKTMMWLSYIMSYTQRIEGEIKSTGKHLTNIKWAHSKQCVTDNSFSFPMVNDEMNFSPSYLGVQFEPSSIKKYIINDNRDNIIFKATPLTLEYGLTAFYPFDENFHNYINKREKVINNGCELFADAKKGSVLHIKNGSSLQLSPIKDYGVVNNSMTIAMDAKLIEAKGTNSVWLGTQNKFYRQGLHIMCRDKTLRAGFYTNGIVYNTKHSINQWHHIVFRYDISNGEQSIFIDGKKVLSSLDHASFIGNSVLSIGKGIGLSDPFEGEMDNLSIWRRALSDNEISMLLTTGIDKSKIKNLKINNGKSFSIPLLIITLLIILIFSTLFIITKRRRKNSVTSKSSENNIKVPSPSLVEHNECNKNAIFLFGNFTALDNDGDNISNIFSPKIRELFLLIFFYSQKANRGISSQQLTDIIWEGTSTAKKTNNRGVAFNKLRHAIENIKGIEVNSENDHWNIKLSHETYCDYTLIRDYLNKVEELSINDFAQFFSIVKRGNLLHRLHWNWLEEFKVDLMYDIADALNEYSRLLKKDNNNKVLSAVSAHTLSIDDLNEQALYYQVYSLKQHGYLSKAKFLLDKFSANYEKCYGKAYDLSIEELLSKEFE